MFAAAPTRRTLRDQRGRLFRDLRISVTDRCNFRCPYCMPADAFADHAFLRRDELLSFDEIELVARAAVALGVEKLRLTGGEPLLRAGLEELVERLAGIDGVRDLALTTNGTLLARQAQALARAGLRRVTVSLDALDPAVFGRMSGVAGRVSDVLDGIAAAREAGLGPVKINMVVRRGVNDGCIEPMARHFHGSGATLRFIEYMDVGTCNRWSRAEVVSGAEIVRRVDAVLPIEPVAPHAPGEVATRWRYRDGGGEIGVIASVTRPFCGDCVRGRLAADGSFYTCLFATEGHDLRGLVRGGGTRADVEQQLAAIWTGRADRYSELRASLPVLSGKVEMSRVGG